MWKLPFLRSYWCLLFFSTANKRCLSEFDFNPTWRVLSGHETPFQALTILSKSHTKKTSNSGKVKVIDLESFFLQAWTSWSWSWAPPPLSSIAPRPLLARFTPPLQQLAEIRTRAPLTTPWPWLAGPPCLQLPKPPPVTAGRTGAPPFLVLMLMLRTTASSFLLTMLLLLMLKKRTSSFMEMLIWMGPPASATLSCSHSTKEFLLLRPLLLTPSFSKRVWWNLLKKTGMFQTKSLGLSCPK